MFFCIPSGFFYSFGTKLMVYAIKLDFVLTFLSTHKNSWNDHVTIVSK